MTRPLSIRIAESAEARNAVYRFRSERGVRPRDTLLPDAQITRGALTDHLDPSAILITAVAPLTQQIVGAVRTHLVRDGAAAAYAHLYGAHQWSPVDWVCSSITSGWTMAWEIRGEEVPLALAQGVYGLALRERIAFDYLDCLDVERPFFERLGYRRLREFMHPGKGLRHLMRLDLLDTSYLRGIGSPLCEHEAELR